MQIMRGYFFCLLEYLGDQEGDVLSFVIRRQDTHTSFSTSIWEWLAAIVIEGTLTERLLSCSRHLSD
jgi:hypothetical protein